MTTWKCPTGLLALALASVAWAGAAPSAPLDPLRRLATTDPAACLAAVETELAKPSLTSNRELQLLLIQGRASQQIQRFDEASRSFDRALALAEEPGLEVFRDRVVLSLGGLALTRGALDLARSRFEDVLDRNPPDAVRTQAWHNLGLVLQRQGRLREAIDAYTHSMSGGQEPLQPIQLARRLSNIASLFNDLGEHTTALEHLARAREQFEKSGRGKTHYAILVNSALAHRGLGQLDVAFEELRQALALQLDAGNEKAAAISMNNMGLVLLDGGDAEGALEQFAQAEEIQRRLDLRDDLASTLINRSAALAQRNNPREAIELAMEGLERGEFVGLKPEQLAARRTLADGHEALQDPKQALVHLQEAARAEQEMRSRVDLQALTRLDAATESPARSSLRWPLTLAAGLAIATVVARILWRRRRHRHRFLPVCSSCKSVRDRRGIWHSFESHLHEAEGVELTHGICPDCVHTLRTPTDRVPT